jgi:hypothetical protein
MVELDEAEVLRLAKALATQDGFTWEFDFVGSAGPRGQRFLSEDRRQEYLARARDEMRKDSDNA